MTSELALSSALAVASFCYFQGVLLGSWFSRGIALILRQSKAEHLERQLRVEVQEALSRLALEILETGEDLTLCHLIEQCPPLLAGGKLQEIWIGESYRLLTKILAEDFKTF